MWKSVVLEKIFQTETSWEAFYDKSFKPFSENPSIPHPPYKQHQTAHFLQFPRKRLQVRPQFYVLFSDLTRTSHKLINMICDLWSIWFKKIFFRKAFYQFFRISRGTMMEFHFFFGTLMIVSKKNIWRKFLKWKVRKSWNCENWRKLVDRW